MTWSRNMRYSAWLMALATAIFTAASLFFLWYKAKSLDVSPWDFLTMAIIVAIVWVAIGAVMAFYVVMIIKKNENRKR